LSIKHWKLGFSYFERHVKGIGKVTIGGVDAIFIGYFFQAAQKMAVNKIYVPSLRLIT